MVLSLVKVDNEQLTQLVATASEEEIYKQVFSLAAADIKSVPGTTVTHILMVERLAFYFAKSVTAARDPSSPYYVEKAWADAFNRLVQELGRETRTLLRDEVFKSGLINTVIAVLREELKDDPPLMERIASRLEAL